MTVQELIDQLSEIKDKTKRVLISNPPLYPDWVSESTPLDPQDKGIVVIGERRK